MRYYSTNKNSAPVSFKEASIQGLAPDKGLYFPEFIPKLTSEWLWNFKHSSKAQIAFDIMKPFVGNSIPDQQLFSICEETVSADFPLQKLTNEIYALELFHGPTLAFKDTGARFMSRCLAWFSIDRQKHLTVLVATSGDTGSAVANGFLGVEGVDVVILYPSGKVSPIQELQLTTLGRNITALEIEGSFDDCQQLVKNAFSDPDIHQRFFLTSANSINVARWLPQQVYYFFALQQWAEDLPPVISVPSGNFGNLCAGLLAFKSGLPAAHFLAACNRNNVFPNFLKTGLFTPANAISTISNAMDVGNPSNFVRILEMMEFSLSKIRSHLSGMSISDELTETTIRNVCTSSNYLLDPHGAVAYQALDQYLKKHPGQKGLFLETAHPVKFSETVSRITGQPVAIPAAVMHLAGLKKRSIKMPSAYGIFKEYLMSREVAESVC
jgi:threonine synthase